MCQNTFWALFTIDYVGKIQGRAAIWSFLKLTALYFTMSDIVHLNHGNDICTSVQYLVDWANNDLRLF